MLLKRYYKTVLLFVFLYLPIQALSNDKQIRSKLLDARNEIILDEKDKLDKIQLPKSRIIKNPEKKEYGIDSVKKELEDKKKKTVNANKKKENSREEKKNTLKKNIERKSERIDLDAPRPSVTKLEENLETQSQIEKIKIFFMPDSSIRDEPALNKFYKTIEKIEKDKKITIRSYSSKNIENTTSYARRLSLSRALKIRSILLETGFLNTRVFVRALGAEKSMLESQDVIVLDIN